MAPRIIALVTYANGYDGKPDLAASPVGSKVIGEHESAESLRVTVELAPSTTKWKPNEVILDEVSAVRSLRDACNRFLDRFYDEADPFDQPGPR